jgi:hypothetical protein
MMGQAIRGGTAFSQILLDDQMIPPLLRDIDIQNKLQEEEEGDLSRFEESDVSSDPCSTAHFQMNMTLPAISEGMDEPDIELSIIQE